MTEPYERTPEDFFTTAIHEAGHAVVCSRFGRILPLVTIIPNVELGAWGRVEPWPDGRFLDEPLDIPQEEAAVLELLGGAAAEVELGLATWQKAQPSWNHDLNTADAMIMEHGLTSRDVLALKAQWLLREQRASLLRVAWALLRCGQIRTDGVVDGLCRDDWYRHALALLEPAKGWTPQSDDDIDDFVADNLPSSV